MLVDLGMDIKKLFVLADENGEVRIQFNNNEKLNKNGL